MNAQAMFTPNGNGYDISPAGLLIIAAGTAYGDPSETTPEGMRNSNAIINEILNAARAGGFTQCDVLHTLLSRNQPTKRIAEMAQAACDAAGYDGYRAVFTGAGQ